MRVTEHTNFNTVRGAIERSKKRMENLQMQSATLKKLNSPSDDPVGAAKILEVRTDGVNNKQFLDNARLAEAFLNNTDHVLEELVGIVMRAKELALSQANGPSSSHETRLGISEEVGQLYLQSISAANRRIGDRYILAGYQTDTPPVDPNGNYQGDKGEMMVEIGRDLFISANIPGFEAFNTEPESSGDLRKLTEKQRLLAGLNPEEEGQLRNSENINLFQELKNFRIALLTGDMEGIRSTLDRFDQLQLKLIGTRAKIGSRIQGIQSAVTAMERHEVTNAQLTTHIEDADMATVMGDLAKEEQVYRGALESAKRLVQPSLLDFLK